MRSGSAIRSITVIVPPVIVKANTTRVSPRYVHIAPGAPSMSAGRTAAARPEKKPATARAPVTAPSAPIRAAPASALSMPICAAAASARSTMSGSSIVSSASKSPSREAARKALTTSRRREISPGCRSASGSPDLASCTRRRARLASCRVATGERSTIGAISSNGTANMSCSTNASRSAGVSVSSTTSSASPTESASTASCSGSVPWAGSAAGCAVTGGSIGSSRRRVRERSMFSDTRATIVVSQPPRFSTPPAPARLSRSQVSCTASSASLAEPSMRYATARRCGRFSSNRSASQSCSFIGHVPPSRCVISMTDGTPSM
jgi:hypothetical protein